GRAVVLVKVMVGPDVAGFRGTNRALPLVRSIALAAQSACVIGADRTRPLRSRVWAPLRGSATVRPSKAYTLYRQTHARILHGNARPGLPSLTCAERSPTVR